MKKQPIKLKSNMLSIGNTPLVKLQRMAGPNAAEIYVKWEGANPTGSMKDRMALSMIEGAEKRAQLRPRGRVVEYTGGSTGSSLAMVCAMKGYKAHFVTSDAFAEEKLRTMRAFGATLEVMPSVNGKITSKLLDEMIARANDLSEAPNTFWTDQINNVDNRNAYRQMAEEIISDLGNQIDEFIQCVGTGASISGNAEVLKSRIPEIKISAIEPYYVRTFSGGETTGNHRLEGIGLGFIPSIYRSDLIDRVIPVKDEDAFETARQLAMTEGICGGITSGANVWAAVQRAKELGPGKKIVTVIIDSGLKYLNGDLFRK